MVIAAVQSGTARRVRLRMTPSPSCTVMTTVLCDTCGEQFQITHRTPQCDAELAQRQARWLIDCLTWDHIQETKHRATIDLPELPKTR